jgi:pyrroloquinoline quinone biosynthesis protein B
MGHLPIAGAEGSLARLAEIPGRTLYIHMNNTNPVLDADSPEAAEVARAGVEIASDGQEFEV